MLASRILLALCGLCLVQLCLYLASSPSSSPSAASFASGEPLDPKGPLPSRTAFDQRLRSSDPSFSPQLEPLSFPPRSDSSYHDASPLSVSRALLQSPLVHRLLVSPSSRVVFCPIPGAAGQQMSDHLSTVLGPLHPMSAFAPRDRERLLLRTDVFRFVFVSHPYTRLLATYYRGIRSPGGLDGRGYRAFMAHVRGSSLAEGQHEMQLVSFQFFLTFLARQGPDQLHNDFLSQSRVCGFGDVNYDFVGRTERFERDMALIHARIGIKGTHIYVDRFVREAKEKAAQLFRNNRFRSKAVKLYGDDFRNFDYSPIDFR